jgi:hypothetical protein
LALSSPSDFELHRPADDAPLSSVEDGGTTAPLASSLLAATVAPDATSTAATDADGNADNILSKSTTYGTM